MLFERSRIQIIESDVERIWLIAGIFECNKKLHATPSVESPDRVYVICGKNNVVDHQLEDVARQGIENGDVLPTHLFACDALDGVFLMKLSGESQVGYIVRVDHKDILSLPAISRLPILTTPKVLKSGKTYSLSMDDGEVSMFFAEDKLCLKVR